ncbi:MAG TPA: aldehyde dehydrogenase family protein [Aldersonia sp.]
MTTTEHRFPVLDQAVADVGRGAESWASTSITDRITLLERMSARVLEQGATMAEAGATAKGYDPDSAWAAEDWVTGPWALVQNISAYTHVLRRIADGLDPVPAAAMRRHRARTLVDVFPATNSDKLLLNGFHAEVWMDPSLTPRDVAAQAAPAYRTNTTRPRVALVLGAGNVAAISALDVLHKLIVEDTVVVAKMNPVNAYLIPIFEDVFRDFVDHDWVRFCDGGAAEGGHLASHAGVDEIHITGSARTHDAIVWGTDDAAEQRRAAGTPLLDKPIGSELGGVSPCIVVPGRWSAADFRYQAEHIVSSKLNNAGHNCIASQVLVLPQDWDGSDRLLDEIRRVMAELPARPDYYPGADARADAVRTAHPDAERCGLDSRLLVTDIADHDDVLITEEVFASVLGVVRLPGSDAAQFLAEAVEFANTVLPGTLGATVIIDPGTANTHRGAVDDALADLRYGTIGVNVWSAFGFLLGYTPWGAFPGNTLDSIGSGVGFVHNAFQLVGVEKTILRAPFAPAPRGLLSGSVALSPKPVFFATNKTARRTVQLVMRHTSSPSAWKLPAIFASALRG